MPFTSRLNKGRELSTVELDNNFICHYPVGSIYINALSRANPSTLIGYGKWEKFAQGYTLLSANSPDSSRLGERPNDPKLNNTPSYYSPGYTDGSPSVKLSNLVQHTHYFQDATVDGSDFEGRHRFKGNYQNFAQVGNAEQIAISGKRSSTNDQFSNPESATDSVGEGLQHNNLQEYITVNIWKRVK
jgi:hypothetical protein